MKQNRSHFGSVLRTVTALLAVGAVLLPVFLADSPWPTAARNYLELHGVDDTGAINLVSAIYLGYRVFDTFGETIVLLVAVSGTIGILARAGAELARGYGTDSSQKQLPSQKEVGDTEENVVLVSEKKTAHVLRTHLVEVASGTLGPIVLLFGFYVMLFGHQSPGGGFQGGVVVASGIVFLALGNRVESSTKLTHGPILSRIEASAFLLLVLASVSGTFVGMGFFDNPFADMAAAPETYIIILNTIIGLKVGTGIGFMCIAMLARETT
ncbi:MAG: MnhB domain-containing protein [Spirochaetota bacterium]